MSLVFLCWICSKKTKTKKRKSHSSTMLMRSTCSYCRAITLVRSDLPEIPRLWLCFLLAEDKNVHLSSKSSPSMCMPSFCAISHADGKHGRRGAEKRFVAEERGIRVNISMGRQTIGAVGDEEEMDAGGF